MLVKEISRLETEKLLRKHLHRCNFDGVKYFVTGWQLRFICEYREVLIECANISVLDMEISPSQFKVGTIDLLETNEPEDSLVALVLFSAINRWAIEKIEIKKNNDLVLTFENEVRCQICGSDKVIDQPWLFSFDEKLVTNDGVGFYISNQGRNHRLRF